MGLRTWPHPVPLVTLFSGIARHQARKGCSKSLVQSTRSSKEILWLFLTSNIISLCPLPTPNHFLWLSAHILPFWKKVQRTDINEQYTPDGLTEASVS